MMTQENLRKELRNETTAIGKARLVFLALPYVKLEDLTYAGIDIIRARSILFQNFIPNKFIRRVDMGLYELTQKGEIEFRKPPRKRGRPAKLDNPPAGLSPTTYKELLENINNLQTVLRRVVNMTPTEERESVRHAAENTLRATKALSELL